MPDELQRILIVTEDVLSERMAGPAIRAWHTAETLADEGHDVVLATLSASCDRPSASFRAEAADHARIAELARWCTIVVVQGFVLERVPALVGTDRVMVVDLYDPLHLEQLERARDTREPERTLDLEHTLHVLRVQLGRGDFFVCASEKQRDLWIGFLSALGRVNPATYERDPALRGLVDVVPFGLSGIAPVHARPSLRGVVRGIAADDEVILWGGGVYDWLDPLTAIRAVDLLRRTRPAVRLYFLGVRHPNPVIEEPRTLRAARALAEELGVAGTHVLFNEGWVAYEDRASFLLEADVAISLHVEHAETAYSFRTRILDYLWAGLPIVATRGDTFAELIEREQLGAVVAGGDAEAVAAALAELLDDPPARAAAGARARTVAGRYVWPEVMKPLVAFCAAPARAADHRSAPPSSAPPSSAPPSRARPPGAVALGRPGGIAGLRARLTSVARRGEAAYRSGGMAGAASAAARAAVRTLRRAMTRATG